MNINTIELCRAFIAQRPQLDPRNYARDWRDADGLANYRSDSRRITRQLRDARKLLSHCATYGISLDAELQHGRLTLKNNALDFTTCQYWSVEYRAAVARAAASAIWSYWRDVRGLDTAQKIYAQAYREFGRGIASRWFI